MKEVPQIKIFNYEADPSSEDHRVFENVQLTDQSQTEEVMSQKNESGKYEFSAQFNTSNDDNTQTTKKQKVNVHKKMTFKRPYEIAQSQLHAADHQRED